MNALKLKVCGMRDSKNINDLEKLNPTMIGLIFVKNSSRYVNGFDIPEIKPSIKKIGVFQNQTFEEIDNAINKYKLDGLQLHGEESPEFCALFKDKILIKTFSPINNFDWSALEAYTKYVSYFLFDTSKNGKSGGTGEKFDWNLINDYKLSKPFLLSGGIKSDDGKRIKGLNHPQLAGVDINSGFEIKAGLKEIRSIKEFQKSIN